MTRDELLALPVTVDVWPTGAEIFGMSRPTAYELARNGQFPVPVIKVGRRYRVSTAEIFKKLGIDPNSGSMGKTSVVQR